MDQTNLTLTIVSCCKELEDNTPSVGDTIPHFLFSEGEFLDVLLLPPSVRYVNVALTYTIHMVSSPMSHETLSSDPEETRVDLRRVLL